jgi:hypothetical protein
MTDPRIAVLSALSSPGWHPVPEAHGMPWDEAEQLLAAYDASRAAAAPSAPAERAARSERYAQAIREAGDTAYGNRPFYEAITTAVIAIADTEQAELRRERDLAIAHDRQPYPTAWAYEQACKALRRKEEAIDRVLTFAASLDETGRQIAGPEAVHPVAARIRHLLDTRPTDGAGRVADETQQSEPQPDTPRCAHCTHPKGDHSDRKDHTPSPTVPRRPWCHACNATCDYDEQTAVEAQQSETQADDEPSCTCAAAGDCFAPAGHYADCPAVVSQPGKEPTS